MYRYARSVTPDLMLFYCPLVKKKTRKYDSCRNDNHYFLFTDKGEESAASERSLLPPLLWLLLHCPGRHAVRQGTHIITHYFLHLEILVY
jgi:hypothetical protein